MKPKRKRRPPRICWRWEYPDGTLDGHFLCDSQADPHFNAYVDPCFRGHWVRFVEQPERKVKQ